MLIWNYETETDNFQIFTEHRRLNPELQDFISESLPYFIKSKNFDVQMRAAQVVVRILSTNRILHKQGLTIKCAIEYCHFVNGLASSLSLEELSEIETSGCGNEKRMLVKDKLQNHSAIVHQFVCGVARNNENLTGYFSSFLVKFYYQNKSLEKNKNVSIEAILEENLSQILDSWTEAGLPIIS